MKRNLRMPKACVWASLIVLSAACPRALALVNTTELGMGLFYNGHSFSLVRNLPGALQVSGYELVCSTGGLNPTGWVSIADSAVSNPAAVTAALGGQALSFEEVFASGTNLAESSADGYAVFQPSAYWDIGAPLVNPSYYYNGAVSLYYYKAGSTTKYLGAVLPLTWTLPPTPHPGGPYQVIQGNSLALSAWSGPGSNLDETQFYSVVSYQWDLNGDGVYDLQAATGSVTVPYVDLESLGLTVGGPRTVALKVTTTLNSTAVAYTTLTITPEPGTLALLAAGALAALRRKRP